jgi:DNA ligase 1
VFDVIKYKGKSVTRLPLLDGKRLLDEIIPDDSSLVAKLKYTEGHGSAFFDLVRHQKLEGIVLKRKDSRYEVGKRSQAWLKVINYQYDDVLITGLRKGKFGLLLSFTADQPAVIIEFMPPEENKATYRRLEVISEDNKFIFTKPIPCRVKYRNITKAGLLLLPSFLEWD